MGQLLTHALQQTFAKAESGRCNAAIQSIALAR